MKVKITGIQGGAARVSEAHVHPFTRDSTHNGLLVLQERFLNFDTQILPAINPNFGAGMNIDGSFGGTPVLIDDGAAGGWNTTAVQGAWNFTDAGRTSITNANNNDEALFEQPIGTTDMTNFVALSGNIILTTYAAANNSISIQFSFGGTVVGNPINLNDFIDTGEIGVTQNVAVLKADLGVSTVTVDALVIIVSRSGGAKPSFSFDDIQIEETGGGIVFTIPVPKNSIYHVDTLRFTVAGPLAGTVADGTMPGLSHKQFLNLPSLTNGWLLTRIQTGAVQFALPIRNLGDVLQAGADIRNVASDGTDTIATFEVKLQEELFIIDESSGDSMTVTINDNMTGLDIFTFFTIGRIEI